MLETNLIKINYAKSSDIIFEHLFIILYDSLYFELYLHASFKNYNLIFCIENDRNIKPLNGAVSLPCAPHKKLLCLQSVHELSL